MGFTECDFKYFVQLDKWNYYAFPLQNEAHIEKGRHLVYNLDMSFKSSTAITPAPRKMVRPTLVKIRRDGRQHIAFIGGSADFQNLLYTPASGELPDQWSYIPKLPKGFNFTSEVACTYN